MFFTFSFQKIKLVLLPPWYHGTFVHEQPGRSSRTFIHVISIRKIIYGISRSSINPESAQLLVSCVWLVTRLVTNVSYDDYFDSTEPLFAVAD